MLQFSVVSSYLVSLMDSECRACKHCPQIIPYNLAIFCCSFLFILPHYFCSSVNKLDRNYFSSVINSLVLVKPYSLVTFVNVGNVITGIKLMLIHFTMSYRCLKFSITWVMIDSLNLMNWTLYLLSVGDINTFKLSSAPVNLLLWCWIYCWLSPLFFWFCLLVWRWLSPFTWLVLLPPWFAFIWSFSPGVDVWIFLCIPICVNGIHISVLTSLLLRLSKQIFKTVQNAFNIPSVLDFFSKHV